MSSNHEKCAPGNKYDNNSCFSLESLKLIAKSYNNLHDDKIEITNDKKQLVKKLTNAFSNKCNDDQTCWLDIDVVKKLDNDDINDTFRPEGPSTGYEWLNTTNINDVVSQYEKKYDDFIFLGAVPNDFEDVPIFGLSNINLDNYYNKNKTKLGMVINLDNHNQSGSHWVALYTDFKKNQLYYFDSFGEKPSKKVKKFNNKILKYMYKKKYNKNINFSNLLKNKDYVNKLKDFDIRYNHIQHQKKNSECGVYSINFILRLAKGESFDNITNNITTDDEINECRQVYFRD